MVIKVSNQNRTHNMTFSHKTQAKTFTWPNIILCLIGCIDAPNKGIEQVCPGRDVIYTSVHLA